nr:DUF4271 domain-containing protein [Cytophagales bacterium]
MKSSRIRFLVAFTCCTCCLSFGYAQVLENFNQELEISTEGLLFKTTEKVSVSIPVKSFPLAYLQLKVPKASAVFLGGVLWDLAAIDTVYQIPMNRIQGLFGANREEIQLVIYNPQIKVGQISVQKVKPLQGEIVEVPALEVNDEFSKRHTDDFREFFFLAVMIILFLIAVFRIIHPSVFRIFLNPRFLVTAEELTDTSTTARFFSSALLFYLLVVNLVLMLIAVSGLYFLRVDLGKFQLAESLNGLFFFWLFGTIIGTVVVFFKYLWLKVFAFVFSIPKFEIPHFLYMLRAVSFGLLVLLAVMVVGIANDVANLAALTTILIKGYFVFYLTAMMMLWILMTNKLTLKNYHLFSYICTAELIPFLVITKLLMG